MTIQFLTEKIRTLLRWCNGHRFKTALYFLGGVIAFEYLTLPNNSLHALRKINPRRTALMRQREAEASSSNKPYTIQQMWVPMTRISPNLVHAVICSEDGTFFEHSGVDWYELEQSVEKNLEKGKAVRGGSTISQQLSKNLFLSTSKNPLRKLKELIITLRMERILSKKRILELYLNIIEWGNGVYGAEAAARKYFGTSAASLSSEQAARMAAVIPAPLRMQPNSGSAYVARRAGVILQRMHAWGYQ
ncbi:MAG: monofunctional biosynthetic peptidoglycan transglycosylase [Ignavibacteriales bacterium]|nr:monofunctional biosynthetic peptidoglycan transglycosylase [Ignavibacteriales bacterium]